MASRLSSNHLLISALSKRQRSKNPLQAGFTLVELLIVVIIIGILAAIALPAFLNQQGRAKINGAQNSAMSTARACAAAQVTGEEAQATPASTASTTGECKEPGEVSTFTSSNAAFDTITEAKAEVGSDGSATLIQCAEAKGWTTSAPPACVPERE